jgi:hypothetical protein
MHKAEILAALQHLTPEELQEVIKTASRLLSIPPKLSLAQAADRMKPFYEPGSEHTQWTDEDPEEFLESGEWESAIATNPSFTFLGDPEEDIYTLEDGKPVDHPINQADDENKLMKIIQQQPVVDLTRLEELRDRF